ncbi:MAG: M14 family zinc carboxypeptidase, partial [Eubacteriales bacterium]|nr:M14 family zinc carboxypeptidase [Eubacteriales bacterium]
MKNKTLTLFVTLLFFLFASNKAYAEEISSFEYVVDPYVEYSYEMMLEDANTLKTKYPDLIRLKSIGTSVEGRDLLLIEFGNGNRKIFLNGATHAREYITTTYLMYMIDRYAYAYTSGQPFEGHDLQAILSGVTFSIVPMVNPDGVNLVQNGIDSVRDKDTFSKFKINKGDSHGYLSWKANINGVDLNRNYPDNWNVKTAVTEPSSSNFKGVSPLSEPESRALATYLNQNMCWAYLTVHSQGAGFYGWNDPNSAYYPQLTEMVSRFAEKSGFKKLSGGSGTSYGNFANYVRETYLKPTFTIELCNYVGSYPYPDQDFDKVFAPVKTLSLIVAEEVIKMSN